MKIEIDIPDWAIGRHIYIMAGKELLGDLQFRREKIRQNGKVIAKEYYLPLRMKPADGRCTGCGDCCNDSGVPEELLFKMEARLSEFEGFTDGNGRCPLLGEDGCSLGAWIPFSCAKSNCEGWSENCTEKMVNVNDIILDVS